MNSGNFYISCHYKEIHNGKSGNHQAKDLLKIHYKYPIIYIM